jgi:hypothetical protein
MTTLTLILELPTPLGDGSREILTLPLHTGYGEDAAAVHDIVAIAMSSDDDVVRLWDAGGELVALPRAWVRAWRTGRDPSPGA